MPLLHRKPFIQNPLPDDLDADEEVFHCPLTNEIFRDYEEFYERTILCNSLVWSCSITDRPNLTYQEALDCEEATRKKLSKVSPSILIPVLYLVGLCNRSRVDDLNEDVYSFVKDRYFVGETVEVTDEKSKLKQVCSVVKVIASNSSLLNGHANGDLSPEIKIDSSEDEDDIPLSTYKQMKPISSSEVQYQIKFPNGNEKVVSAACVRRKQGVYNRHLSKLFLKANCVKPLGQATDNYVVKDEVKKRFKLDTIEFDDIFDGYKPCFTLSPKSQKLKKVTGNSAAKSKSEKAKEVREKEELKNAREAEREEKRKEKEEQRKKKAEEMEKVREAARVDKERKRKEREVEIIKMKVEKENLRHQKQEEKKRLAEYLKEWSRPRDDLECDDLKYLPAPVELKTAIPHALFGDVLTLLEFFNSFADIFDVADEFPEGVTLGLLSDALTKCKQDGPLCDLLFFFLSNLFRTHSEEEEVFENIHIDSADPELSARLKCDVNEETLMAFATLASTWPAAYQGFPLNKLELDSFTLTEVLRLYLLTSAARPRGEDRQWRYQQRGGYSTFDDTPADLCLLRPEIIEKLTTGSVFDLEADEKLAVLICLCNHLMSFVAPRDCLDENGDKLQQAQQAYRDDRALEKKRERDLATEKSKFKCEQFKLAKQARLKETEEKLRKIELGIEEETDEANTRKRKEMEDESENMERPVLLDPLERAKRLRLFEEEEEQAKEAWNYRKHNHLQTIDKHQTAFRITALGVDRFYRRYWSISSVPGLFVEEYIDPVLTETFLALKVPQKPSYLSTSGYVTPVSDCSARDTPVMNLSLKVPESGSSSLNTTQNSSLAGNGLASPQFTDLTSPDSSFATVQRISTGEFRASPALKQVLQNNLTQANQSSNRNSINLPEELRPPADNFTQGKQYRWFVYTSAEDIDNLIAALNTRGFRESKLSQNLIAFKEVISERFINKKKRLAQLLSLQQDGAKEPAHEKCSNELENLLRDQLLDLEARLWAGTLGFVKVGNRESWRESIQLGKHYDGTIKEDTSMPSYEADDNEEDDGNPICDPVVSFPIRSSAPLEDGDSQMDTEDRTNAVVRGLAVALLIVERGVDRKYLKSPLGWAVDITRGSRSRASNQENEETTKRKSERLLRRWERSLLSCTSISQVFLHLSTLERCIMWSRSILNAKCRICRRKGDAEKMLLCDACDRGHHMYCLKPALKSIPEGDWFCPHCKPKSSRLSPRKVVRTKSFSQDESSDSDEEEDSTDTDVAESEQEESSDEEESSTSKKRKLTYKIPQKSKKSSGRGRVDSKKERTKRSATKSPTPGACSSRRRTAAVWRDLALCEDILSELLKHKDSWPFLDPVSKKLVPDYYAIIKRPMDLGTVLKKLKNVQYASPSDFIEDVDLIFQNCHEYNDSRCSIAKCATHLQTFFDSRLNKNGLSNYRIPYNPSKKRRTT